MSNFTTVRIDVDVLEALSRFKKHQRESYNEVISELVDFARQSDKYRDTFLSQIQKVKMKELWDNKEDEVWEHV